jgi:hypothetical protein
MNWIDVGFGILGAALTYTIVHAVKSKTPLEVFLDRCLLIGVLVLIVAMGVLWYMHKYLSAFEFVHEYPRLSDIANFAAAGLVMKWGWD